jgi:hypothetical protein
VRFLRLSSSSSRTWSCSRTGFGQCSAPPRLVAPGRLRMLLVSHPRTPAGARVEQVAEVAVK